MDGSDRGGAPQEQQQDAAAWQRAMAMAQQQRRPGGRLPGLYASLPASLHDQECAGASSKRWLALQRARLAALAAAPRPELATDAPSGARGEVLWLDADAAEARYLLAAAGDGAIEVYDLAAAAAVTAGGAAPARVLPVASARQRGGAGGGAASSSAAAAQQGHHRYAATCVQWYPVDTGMFASGSADETVRLWDTNELTPVAVFGAGARVSGVAMSPAARAHCLVAVAAEARSVRLADPASGAFTHELLGHRDPVTCVAWSLTAEHELVSGDAAGEARVWDVRRPGALALLDMANTAVASAGSSGGIRNRGGRGGAAAAAGRPRARPRAHDGGVVSLLPTPDGLHLVTGGRDGALRLWDSGSHAHLLVNYDTGASLAAGARRRRPLRLAATEDGRWLFAPTGRDVHVLRAATGARLASLRGAHFEPINAAAWSALTQQLYTAASDGGLVAWAPAVKAAVEDDERAAWRGRGAAPPEWAAADEDAWSDEY